MVLVERVTGIEPVLSAWEAEVLPLNYTRSVVAHHEHTSYHKRFSRQLLVRGSRAWGGLSSAPTWHGAHATKG